MSNHGGKREGAGRKAGTGKYGEPTRAMRVPESLIKDVKEFVRLKRVKSTRIQFAERRSNTFHVAEELIRSFKVGGAIHDPVVRTYNY